MLVVINKNSLMRCRLCDKLHGGRSQLLFALHQSSMRQPDIRPESRCLPSLHLTPRLGGPCRNNCHAPVGDHCRNNCHDVSCGNTRMMWLPDGEKVLKMCLFISTESTNVTDRQTDGHTTRRHIGRAYA